MSKIVSVGSFENLSPGQYNDGTILINTTNGSVGVFDGTRVIMPNNNYMDRDNVFRTRPSLLIPIIENQLEWYKRINEDNTHYIRDLIKLKESLDNILIKYI